MKQSLRKLATSIQFRYADGTQAWHLIGTDFHLDKNRNFLCLSLDLSANLDWRRSYDSRREAEIFLQRHSDLQSVHIPERGMAGILARVDQDFPVRYWKLDLLMNRPFTYAVLPHFADWRVSFSVPGKPGRSPHRPPAEAPRRTIPAPGAFCH
jgi:hypothetical protein